MADGTPGDRNALLRAAQRLNARAPSAAGRWPPLILVTDPARIPDPVACARRLPRGSAIIYRAFGAVDALELGLKLRDVARDRGLVLLVGADPRLAQAMGADGVHLPERLAHRARRIRLANPGWIVTAAAHGRAAVRKAERAGVQAVLVSPVFDSASPSASRALGVLRFAALVRASRIPVYALGGVNASRATRLISSGAIGIAAVDALSAGGRAGNSLEGGDSVSTPK